MLSNKVVLITGAAGLLGSAIARMVVDNGGNVIIGDILVNKGKELENELGSNKALFINIDTNVIEGMVLLTGIVENQEFRIEAVKIVWEVGGVKEVINEIEIGDKTSIKEYANDIWITAQIKTLATRDIGLRSISYNVETIKGKVFLAGITSRPEQLETLVNIVKSVKGVKDVVNYVVIKE